jgi:hypothetical protein
MLAFHYSSSFFQYLLLSSLDIEHSSETYLAAAASCACTERERERERERDRESEKKRERER